MKEVYFIFEEIKTQYKIYSIQLYDDEKIDLVTEIVQWQKLKKQDELYIKRLRKNNIKVKYFKIMNPNKTDKNKTIGFYYKLYAIKKIPFNKKCCLVNKILNKKVNTGYTLKEQIEYVWSNKNYKKISDDNLNDKESVILSRLAQYLYFGYENDEKNILTREQKKEIKKKEVSDFESIGNYINYNGNYKLDGEPNTWEIHISTKNRMRRFRKNKKYKGAINRWKKSKTYKINSIYTYDNKKIGKYHWCRKGIIDNTKPYKSQWCVVDANNIFEFDNCKYHISGKVKQFDIGKNDKYKMDKILVYEQDNNIHFFDQNIDRIENKFIMEL